MSPAADDHQLSLHRTLLEALGGDPFVRFELDPGTLADVEARPGQAIAWVGQHRTGLRWATGLAADPTSDRDVKVAVELLTAVAARSADAGSPVSGVTISRGGRSLLPDHLRQPEAWEWDHWCTEQAPAPEAYAVPGGAVVDLAADDPRIAALLEVASPTASIPAGDPRVARWAGLEDVDAADDTRDTGGLVGLVAVTLGMYADNDAARALYSALGFTCVRGQTSGRLHA